MSSSNILQATDAPEDTGNINIAPSDSTQQDLVNETRTTVTEPDIILAKNRRSFSIQDEFVLILINDLVKYIIDSWEGQPCTRTVTVTVTETTNLSEEKSVEKVPEGGIADEKETEEVPSPTDETKYPLKADFPEQGVQIKEKGKKRKKLESVLDLKDDSVIVNKASRVADSAGKKRGKEKKVKESYRSPNDESKDEENIPVVVENGEKILAEQTNNFAENVPTGGIPEVIEEWKLQLFDEDVNVIFKQGNCYEGRVSNKLMEGKGTFTWSDGSVYKGDFSNGQINGHGHLEWPDLSWYEGDFYCGYRHGSGTFVSTYGHVVYVGHWFMGHKHGQGILYFTENINDFYDGDWVMDVRHGEGVRKYPSGACYVGGWKNNLQHGLGTMVWPNNDLYRGGWKAGMMSGYGEYTWSAFLNKQFAYPKENIYRGIWENGKRHGNGKLELSRGGYYNGSWDFDIKQGAGLVVCGNGSTVSQDPLFHHDRPIVIEEEENEGKKSTEAMEQEISMEVLKANRKRIIDNNVIQLFPKKASVPEVAVSNSLHKDQVHVNDSRIKPIPKRLSLKVAVNAPSQDLDLSYHLGQWRNLKTMQLMNDYCNTHKIDKKEINETNKIVAEAVKELAFTLSKEVTRKKSMKYEKQQTDIISERNDKMNVTESNKHLGTNSLKVQSRVSSRHIKKKISKIHERKLRVKGETSLKQSDALIISAEDAVSDNEVKYEEKWLRNIITKYLLHLRTLYSQYATVACHEELTFEPVLSRIMLWQMYRDCHISDKNVTLIQLDKLLAANPTSLIQNEHDPFERIEFWQFLHSLLELSWLLYASKGIEKENTPGVLASAFHILLTDDILPNAGNHIGSVLFDKCDLLPLTAVYLKYRGIGEPHSARCLLSKICTRKGEALQKSEIFFIPEFPDHILNGTNAIGVGGDIMFIPEREPLTSSVAKKDCKHDLYLTQLNSLCLVGVNKTVDCLTQVCPGIKSEEGLICNMEYELTFLEFYEVLLLIVEVGLQKLADKQSKLALKAVKKQMLAVNAEHDAKDTLTGHVESPSSKTNIRKKKKK